MADNTQHKYKTDRPGLPAEVKEYLEKRIQLFTLTIYEKAAMIVAYSFQRALGVLFIAGGILFAWFALSYFVGRLVGDTGLGFLISSLPLFIAGFVFLKQRSKSLTEKIQAELIGRIIQNIETEHNSKEKKGADEAD